MNDPAYLLLAITWFVGCAAAAVVGRGLSRIASLLLLAQLVVEYFGWMIAPDVRSRPVGSVSGVLLVVFFIWAAAVSRTRWASIAAGGQLMSVAIHTMRSRLPHVQMWAFVTARDIFGFIVLGAVIAGAWASRGRRA